MKVTIRRRYGSPPGVSATESALAMFSVMMRMRPICARKPEAAMVSDFMKSMVMACPARVIGERLAPPALAL